MEPRSIPELIRAHVERDPDGVALLAPDRAPMSYRQLETQMSSVGRLLRGVGVKRNDRVALIAAPGLETAVATVAIASAAVCVPVNPGSRPDEVKALLARSKARAVVSPPGLDVPVRALAESHGVPTIELDLALDDGGALPAALDGHPPSPGDPAFLLETSGTTALPKAVPLTHANILATALNMRRGLNLSPADRCLNVMPLSHIHGLMVMMASVASGSSVVVVRLAGTSHIFELLDQFRPTWYSAVPTIHQAILSGAKAARSATRPQSLRFIRSCSAALPVSVAAQLEELFQVPVVEAYGMTEAAHQIASNPLPPRRRKPGSVGVPTGCDVAVMRDDGGLLPPNARGEIVVRGPNVMTAYDGSPEVNARAFIDGWFRTGDQGFVDDEGYVFLTGRLKEIINRGGEKVSPLEVDRVLSEHPAVAESAAFGVAHPSLGEDVAAAVVLREGVAATDADIRRFVAARLADYKVPRRVVFVTELPRGRTGKIDRGSLTTLYGDTPGDGAGQGRRVPYVPPAHVLEFEVARIWGDVLQRRNIGVTESFFDLGGNSLLAAEMIARVEALYGYRLPVALLLEGPTVRDVTNKVVHRPERSDRPKLITLRDQGTRPPLYYLHGDWGGGGFYCFNLVQYLESDRPVHVLSPHGLDGEEPLQSIEAMASDHVRTMRAHQPVGPYVLAGFCNGALVALEAAQQLVSGGQQVDMLVLIDPARTFVDARAAVKIMNVLMDGIFRIRGVPAVERANRINAWRTSVGNTRDRLKGRLPIARPQAAEANGRAGDAGLRRLAGHYTRVNGNYRARPYGHRAAIIWGEDTLRARGEKALAYWRGLLPHAVIEMVHGGHISMRVQYVQELARRLQVCLEGAG